MAVYKTPRNTTFEVINSKIDQQNAMLTVIAGALSDGQAKPTTWAAFKQLVKSGNADKVYSVGDVFVVERATEITISKADSTGVTAATVDMAGFLAGMGKTRGGLYELTYDGSVWKWSDGETAVLSAYGITTTGTAAEGDHLVVTETTEKIAWMIIGFDQEDGIPEGCTHSVTLNTVDLVIKEFQYDASEVMYYCETALAAGVYNFTLDHGAENNLTTQDGTYQFTTTQQIPAGGGIRHTTIGEYYYNNPSEYTKAKITGGTITTYSNLSTGTTLQTGIVVTEGSSGTSLGTFTALNPTYGSSGNCNFTQAIFCGSNNYADSDARMWINSPAAPGAWWSKSSKFDLPNSKTNIAGFLYGLDKEFVSVLSPVTKKWQRTIADGYGLGEVTDKMFLLARSEVYMGSQRPGDGSEGNAYTYYSRFSALSSADVGDDSNRIKYAPDGSAQHWRLRSANAYGIDSATNSNLTGALNYNGPKYVSGIAPACVIAA